MDKKKIKEEKEQQLLKAVSSFCEEKLNEEYSDLCAQLVKKIGRKRDVPFMSGRIEIWAASIIYTVGMLNFLFDKSFEPYIQAKDIHDYFDTKSSTVGAKSRFIRDLLKLDRFNNDFSTNGMLEINPLHSFVIVDDMLVPLDSIPEEYQKIVKEARENGEDVSFRTNS